MNPVNSNNTTKIKTLLEVLAYKNEDVIYRFMDHFDLDEESSMEIFEETKKWLWLTAINNVENIKIEESMAFIFIDQPLLIIDEMWHTFILYTMDYRKFCQQNFGFFIDHNPTRKAEKDNFYKRMKSDPEGIKKENEEKLKYQYSLIYDHLGEETLVKWYNEFPEKYSPEVIKRLKKR